MRNWRVIKNQNESMQVQNEMLAKQLKASLEEAAINRQQEIRRISPLFDVRTVATTAGERFIQIEDVKARIKWSEIRCNTKWTNSSVGITSPSSKTIEVPGNFSTIYIGIRYHRLVDNEEIAVVLAFNTVTGKA